MSEHSGTLAEWLVGALTLLGGAFAVLWRTREKDKENQVATALRELGAEIKAFGTKFDDTVLRIFDKIEVIEKDNRARDVRCAALHGKGPGGWDGTERRQRPRN